MIEESKEDQVKEEGKVSVENQEISPAVLDLIKGLEDKILGLEKTPSDIEALAAAISGTIAKNTAIAPDSLTGGVDPSTGQYRFHQGSQYTEINEDDLLPPEEVQTFITHKMLYFIADDKRNGRSVRAPFDLIRFKYNSTKTIKNGNETDQLNISTYTCESRIELDWLRNHTLFNVMFFDKLSNAISSDAQKAARLAKHMMALSGMGQTALVKMAKSRNLVVGEDIGVMRAMIAQDTVKAEMEKVEGETQRMLEEQQFEADVVKRKVTA